MVVWLELTCSMSQTWTSACNIITKKTMPLGNSSQFHPMKFLYQDANSSSLLHRLDCSTSSPVCVDAISLVKGEKVQELCYLNGIMVFVCEGCLGIYAQTLSGESLWTMESIVSDRYTHNMKCTSVTMVDNRHVFVMDTNPDCIVYHKRWISRLSGRNMPAQDVQNDNGQMV